MTPEEKHAYERRQDDEREAIWEVMAKLPAVLRATRMRIPLKLTCPRGHRLTTVVLDKQGDEWRPEFWLFPADAKGRGRRVTDAASPLSGAGVVCAVHGCPTRIQRGRELCPEHSEGRESIVIDHLKTAFICPLASCGWSESVRTPRLLKVVTAAIVAGATERISVTGASARRPH